MFGWLRRGSTPPRAFVIVHPPSVYMRLHQTVLDDDAPLGEPVFVNPALESTSVIRVDDVGQSEVDVPEAAEALVIQLGPGDYRVQVGPAEADVHLLRIVGSGRDATRLTVTRTCPAQRVALSDLELVGCHSDHERSWPANEIALGDVRLTDSVIHCRDRSNAYMRVGFGLVTASPDPSKSFQRLILAGEVDVGPSSSLAGRTHALGDVTVRTSEEDASTDLWLSQDPPKGELTLEGPGHRIEFANSLPVDLGQHLLGDGRPSRGLGDAERIRIALAGTLTIHGGLGWLGRGSNFTVTVHGKRGYRSSLHLEQARLSALSVWRVTHVVIDGSQIYAMDSRIGALIVAGSTYVAGRPDGSFTCDSLQVEEGAHAELHELNAYELEDEAIESLAGLDHVSLWFASSPDKGGRDRGPSEPRVWTSWLARPDRWFRILRVLEDHHAPALTLSRARRSATHARYLYLLNLEEEARERFHSQHPVSTVDGRLRVLLHAARAWLRPSDHSLELYVLRLYRLIGFGESLARSAAWYLLLATVATLALLPGASEGLGTPLRVLAAPLTLLGGDDDLRLSSMSGIDLVVWYGFKLVGVVLLGFVVLNVRRLATNRSQ